MNYRGELHFTGLNDMERCYRVTTGERATSSCGLHSISHSALSYNQTTNAQYLEDDCLHIRVKEVAFYSIPDVPKVPSWQDPNLPSQSVYEFTLNEFSKRKQFNNQYYTSPFYTHYHGYKLQLKVSVNGDGSRKGSHVSVFAYLMKGEYDDSLKWPFCADLTIELLNWREDQNHIKTSFRFPEAIGAHVSQGVRGGNLGIPSFVSHSSLPCEGLQNMKYVENDCLRFRVNVAVVSR